MVIKSPVEKLLIKVTTNRTVSKKQLITSYVSLFLAVVVLSTATFSWFTTKDSARLGTSAVTMTASSGLRVNNGEDLSGIVKLSENVKLSQASSFDGRDMYFPTTGTLSNTTAEMVFREGNAGDKNINYFYNDFELKADSGDTDVYVKSYEIVVGGKSGNHTYSSTIAQAGTVECPIRIAFINDSSQTPIVIDPTAAVKEHCKNYNAVLSTDSSGRAITKKTEVQSFAEFYYATSNPIFTIPNNNPLELTMVIWLEGTGGNCDEFVGQNISVNIEFESNWEHMDTIKFIDDTVGDTDENVKHWINTGGCLVTMTYYDYKTDKYKTVPMIKSANYNSDYTWTAAIPDYITTNIRFNRYMPSDAFVWNAWYTETGVNNRTSQWVKNKIGSNLLQETRIYTKNSQSYRSLVYTAQRGNGYSTTDNQDERLSPCVGYWSTSGGKLHDITVPVEPTTPTVEPTTTQPTQPSTPSTGKVNVGISLEDQTSNRWINTNTETKSDGTTEKIYFIFSDGTEVEIPKTAFGYFEKGNILINANSGIKLSRFEIRDASNKAYYTWNVSGDIEVKKEEYFNFLVDSNNNLNLKP